MHQTARGEVVGGAEVAERPQVTLGADVPVMAATAKAYAEMFPQLGVARILRQWAGLVHISKDFGPLLGAPPQLGGLDLGAGWCYGHAGAPAAGELLAKAMVTGVVDERMQPFAVDRFQRNCPVVEPGMRPEPLRMNIHSQYPAHYSALARVPDTAGTLKQGFFA